MDEIRRRDDSPGIYDPRSAELNQTELTPPEQALYSAMLEPQKAEIRKVIDFFNDLAHLMRNRYIDRKMIVRRGLANGLREYVSTGTRKSDHLHKRVSNDV